MCTFIMMGTSVAYATENTESIIVENDDSPSTRAWPGSGPAAQVSDIKIIDKGFLDGDTFPGRDGHYGIVVKVTGYGTDYATLDGEKITHFQRTPFIITGTLADGFYYYYDCGISESGSHRFYLKMVSINSPYTTRTISTNFTI